MQETKSVDSSNKNEARKMRECDLKDFVRQETEQIKKSRKEFKVETFWKEKSCKNGQNKKRDR